MNEDTWYYLEEFDVIGLTETWMEAEGWIRIRGRLSNKFSWNCIPAKRENRKGRAEGGIIVAVNKVLQNMEFREVSHRVAEVRLKYNRNKWKIVIYYGI